MLIGGVTSGFAQKSGAAVLNVLNRKEPDVKWNAKSLIQGDFDYDGVTDYALRGRKKEFFVLGIVKGALTGKSAHWTLEFGADAGNQDALCAVESAVITVEILDRGYAEFAADYLENDFVKMIKSLPKKSRGINIADGQCDSFHVLWDKKARQFTWWRI